jgi:hypothetical protein
MVSAIKSIAAPVAPILQNESRGRIVVPRAPWSVYPTDMSIGRVSRDEKPGSAVKPFGSFALGFFRHFQYGTFRGPNSY